MITSLTAFFKSSRPVKTDSTKHVDEHICLISHTPISELTDPYRASDGGLYEPEYLVMWLQTILTKPASPLTRAPMRVDDENLVGPLPEPSIDALISGMQSDEIKAAAILMLGINRNDQRAFVSALRPVLGQSAVGLSQAIFMPRIKGDKDINFGYAVALGVSTSLLSIAEKNICFRPAVF